MHVKRARDSQAVTHGLEGGEPDAGPSLAPPSTDGAAQGVGIAAADGSTEPPSKRQVPDRAYPDPPLTL